MKTTLIDLKAKETGRPCLLVVSEDVPDIGKWQTEITNCADHSRLNGPIEDMKWRMLAAVWKQLDVVRRAHQRNKPNQRDEQET